MGFLQKKARGDGWTAVVFGADRIAMADIKRQSEERPVVRSCDSFAREGSDLDVLKRLKNAKRLKNDHCTTLLWHGQYQLLQVDAPDNLPEDGPREELREALRWRVKEMVDFSAEQAGRHHADSCPGSRSRAVRRARCCATHPVVSGCQGAAEAIDIPELAQRNCPVCSRRMRLVLVAFDDKGTAHHHLSGELTRHTRARTGWFECRHAERAPDIQRSGYPDRNCSDTADAPAGGPLPVAALLSTIWRANFVAGGFGQSGDGHRGDPGLADRWADAWLALGAALRDQ
jgi:hypothetical protein